MMLHQDTTKLKVFTLRRGPLELRLTNYGATIMSINTPDLKGESGNIVAGFDTPEEYLGKHPYLGAVIGRFTNRITGGSFKLDGETIHLSMNEEINQLHGGFEGFNRKTWLHEIADDYSITFRYRSVDGEEGYPGNLDATVTYRITPSYSLLIEYMATTDKPTIVSMTNHSYFNLSAFKNPTINDHYLQINADKYTVKNAGNSSTGEMEAVKSGPLDFRSPQQLGRRIDELVTDMGYDHNFVLKAGPPPAAILYDPSSGRWVKVYTDQLGMQVYTSNWWDGTITGAHKSPYVKHGAVALETQALPDSPNHETFPSVVLRPGETYHRFTIFEFGTSASPSGL